MTSDNRWRLHSPAAADVRWYFRCAGAALGLRASPCEAPAETVRERRLQRCRCGALVGEWRRRCPMCDEPLPGLGTMRARGSRPGASSASTEKDDRCIAAVAKERRIRTALEQLSSSTYHTLRIAYEARQHGPEIRRVLGEFSDLAMRMPRCRAAYAKYCEGGGKLELETWLVKRCRENGRADSALLRMREEAESAIGAAVGAYQLHRIQPTDEERAGEARPVQRPRRSPLERVRTEIERLLGAEAP